MGLISRAALRPPIPQRRTTLTNTKDILKTGYWVTRTPKHNKPQWPPTSPKLATLRTRVAIVCSQSLLSHCTQARQQPASLQESSRRQPNRKMSPCWVAERQQAPQHTG